MLCRNVTKNKEKKNGSNFYTQTSAITKPKANCPSQNVFKTCQNEWNYAFSCMKPSSFQMQFCERTNKLQKLWMTGGAFCFVFFFLTNRKLGSQCAVLVCHNYRAYGCVREGFFFVSGWVSGFFFVDERDR